MLNRPWEQAVDDFLLNLFGEFAADHCLRNLAGAESGNLGILAEVGGHAAIGFGDLIGRNINHQLAGAFRIEDGSVLVVVALVVMVMAFVSMVVAFVRGFMLLGGFIRCAGLRVAFDGVCGTQRFAFQARRGEPIEMPLRVNTNHGGFMARGWVAVSCRQSTLHMSSLDRLMGCGPMHGQQCDAERP